MKALYEFRYLIHPHGKRIPVSHEEPLSDVELCVVDQQGSLYVLLDHPAIGPPHHRVPTCYCKDVFHTSSTSNTCKEDEEDG